VPDVLTLIGHTGVALMIFESGLHFDFEQAKTVGPWACAVAVLGTLLPLGAGTALSMAYGFPLMASLAAGTALAPTSVGIALKLLHEAKALQLYFGQAVMTAAFVDDVLSLILFSVLFNLGDDVQFMDFFPLIMGCVFMVVAIIAAVTVWPKIIEFIFKHIPEKKAHAKLTTHDEVMWLLMFATLVAYATITDMCGTHLWGCFIAGMSFATQKHAHHVWVRQVKRTTCWWLRIFFGCTLAWSIPVKELFSLEAFWKGTIMGIGPCIATKVLCGPFMGEARWVIGWAMVGRAEFAYFIAILAKSLTMMDAKLFAILVWALIYATIFAPLIFRFVLKRYMQKLNPEAGSEKCRTITHQAARASRHLPDLEAADEEKNQAEMKEKLEELEKELAQKNDQIKKLMELNSVTPETTTATPDDLEAEVAVLDTVTPDTTIATLDNLETRVSI
jgi:Kef-type K+ transport system membrane component KefB